MMRLFNHHTHTHTHVKYASESQQLGLRYFIITYSKRELIPVRNVNKRIFKYYKENKNNCVGYETFKKINVIVSFYLQLVVIKPGRRYMNSLQAFRRRGT